MVRIEPIKNSTVKLVSALLKERNSTITQYTNWKYCRDDDNIDRGYLAYYDDTCVGCFGLVPLQVNINGNIEKCGWFADWYVSAEYRKYGIGEKLLQALSTNYRIVFGHPGPEKAQKLCIANNYVPIPNQLRLRYILNKWSYIKGKSSLLPKQLLLLYKLNSELRTDKKFNTVLNPELYFNQSDEYKKWIQAQPTAPHYNASYKEFHSGNTNILYLLFSENGRLKGKVIDYKNINSSSLNKFLNIVKQEGVEYIDVFTTEAHELAILSSYPCIKVNEAPIMVHGLDASKGVKIKGIDRENWTNLSY